MGVQMWFIASRGDLTDETSRALQHAVREQGGLIMMVTRTGPIVALDDAAAAEVERHPLVAFMGPVQLNPRGLAADRLQRIFAENLSKQVDLEALEEAEAAS
jgi:hypothetical protein